MRASDPHARRLRRFVLLVILAVALPSLLLSGFGLIAIQNEHDATLQRLRALYAPTLQRLSGSLEARLEAIAARGSGALEALGRWAARESRSPGPDWAGFRADVPWLVGCFALDGQGRSLLPRPVTDPGGGQFEPAALRRARAAELERKDLVAAAAAYRELAAAWPEGRCRVQNALARTLLRAGQRAEASRQLDELAAACSETADAFGYNLGVGAALLRLESVSRDGIPVRERQAQALLRKLADPVLPVQAAQRRFAARRALELLGSGAGHEARQALAALADEGELHAACAGLAGRVRGCAWYSLETAPGRSRLVLLRGRGDGLVGCELVPARMAEALDALIDSAGLGGQLGTALRVGRAPPSAEELGRLAGSTWLGDERYALRLDLLLAGDGALQAAGRSRAQLYLWSLVLLVIVLGLGIGATLWQVVRETRLSALKTDFVSNVSHELRTPLTSIRLFSDTLLMDRVQDEGERRECLQVIGQESERLSRLVERILDFARMEAGRRAYRLAPVRIEELVDEAVAACRPLLDEKGFAVERDVPDSLPALQADRDAIVEALLNLISNAVKYSAESRSVRLEARLDAEQGMLRLAVVDRGIGIPRQEQARIFDKFYRVETGLSDHVAGSGLGLSLVRYIARAHGGDVEVESAPGRGSTFTLRLPISQREPEAEHG